MIKEIEFARRIIKTRLSCGKSILESTQFEDVAYWWNVNFLFHQHVLGLIDGSCAFHPPTKLRRHVRNIYRVFFDPTIKIIYRLLGCRPSPPSELPKGVFVCRAEERQVRDIKTGRLIESDFIFDPLVSEMGNRFDLKGIYSLDSLRIRKHIETFLRKRKNLRFRQMPVDAYWNYSVTKKFLSARRFFQAQWRVIESDESLVQLCSHEGTDYYEQVMEHLEFCFLDLLPLAVRAEKLGENILYEEKADFALVEYEYGPIRKSLAVIAPRKSGLPSIAVQHGNIYATHPGYFYHRDEISPPPESCSQKCIIPNVTCLSGNKYRRILVDNCGYPDSAVAVTGQPRYDILFHSARLFSSVDFKARYAIPSDKKIVLWTTQSHGLSDKENITNLHAFAMAFAGLKNVVLIVKQHPNEGDKYTRLIKNYLDKPEIDLRMPPRDSDTFEQLYFCDLLISKFSTTATEAVAMGKPLLILNLGETADRVDYVDSGVAVGVYKPEDLEPSIIDLLDNPDTSCEIRRQYISENLFIIDGQASRRVGDVIDRQLNK